MYTYIFSYLATEKDNEYRQIHGHISFKFNNKLTLNDVEKVLDKIKEQGDINPVLISISPIDGEDNNGFYVVSIASMNENLIKTFSNEEEAKNFIKEEAKKYGANLEDKENQIAHNWWKIFTGQVHTEYRIHHVKKIGE